MNETPFTHTHPHPHTKLIAFSVVDSLNTINYMAYYEEPPSNLILSVSIKNVVFSYEI